MCINKPVIIIGAGGHAKVVADALTQVGVDLLGLTDVNKKKDDICFGLPVLGGDEIINKYSPDKVLLANGLGTLPEDKSRWELAKRMREAGYSFITVVHPSATIADSVSLAEGVQVMAGCILQPEVSVGQDSIINTGVILDHDCMIGENCHIAPGVTMSGGVHVDNETHVGTAAIILQNISIGSNTIIAAGSVIYHDVLSDVKFIQSKNRL